MMGHELPDMDDTNIDTELLAEIAAEEARSCERAARLAQLKMRLASKTSKQHIDEQVDKASQARLDEDRFESTPLQHGQLPGNGRNVNGLPTFHQPPPQAYLSSYPPYQGQQQPYAGPQYANYQQHPHQPSYQQLAPSFPPHCSQPWSTAQHQP
eukprot:4377869-Pleurochrysis_carterae.AAC.1